jgi:hypothetical protein
MFGGLLSALARARRVPREGWKTLTGKNSPKYYKGKNAMKTGVHDRYGNFVVLPDMMPKYVVPKLEGCQLQPYVQHYLLRKDDKALLGLKTLAEKRRERRK